MFRLTLWCLLSSSLLVAGPMLTEVYGEQGYLGREELVASTLRVRSAQPVTGALDAFVQGGTELMTAGFGESSLDPGSSYAYFGPGLRWQSHGFALLTDARVRGFYHYQPTSQSPQQAFDWRALAVYGWFGSHTLASEWRLDAFAEAYAESMLTSADFFNLVNDGYVRLGFRHRLARAWDLDAFLETFGAIDRIGHYYNNLANLKPSLRLQFHRNTWTVGVIGSYVTTRYFARGDFDPNPYAGIPNGVRVLAVFGGEL